MLVIYLPILWHLVEVEASLAATHLIVTHVGPCEGQPRTVLTLDELTITTQTYDSSLTGQFNISADVDDGWTVTATMQKCQDIRNTDTCDHFSSFRVVSDGCRDEDAEEMYIMLFHYVTPLIECPIRAGEYQLVDYPFFSEHNYLTVSESKISTSVFGYTFRLDGTTVDRRKFFCVEAYLQLMYMREHNWIKSNTKHPQATLGTPNINEDDKESK